MKVLITNTVALNGGDAAILVGIEKHLREVFGDEVEIAIHDSQPETAKQFYPHLDFHPITATLIEQRLPPIRYVRRLLRKFTFWRFEMAARQAVKGRHSIASFLLNSSEKKHLQRYLDCDLLISTGGTYLVEHYDLRIRLLELAMMAASNKPWILYTQSLGPFHNYDRRIANALATSKAIFLRDERSRQNLVDIGVELSKCHVCHDVVFGLHEPNDVPVTASPKVRVAVSVRKWNHFTTGSSEAYGNAIRGLVQHLVDAREAEVTFVSTCQGIPGYLFNDSEFAETIVDTLPPHVRSKVTVDSAYHSPLELQESLREFDVVVATRMHMSILAMTAEVPVVNIAYEFKSQELFETAGLGDWLVDINEVNAGLLIDKVDRALERRADLRLTLREVLPTLKRSADAPRDWLSRNVRVLPSKSMD